MEIAYAPTVLYNVQYISKCAKWQKRGKENMSRYNMDKEIQEAIISGERACQHSVFLAMGSDKVLIIVYNLDNMHYF